MLAEPCRSISGAALTCVNIAAQAKTILAAQGA
jgi:hypothetical protein